MRANDPLLRSVCLPVSITSRRICGSPATTSHIPCRPPRRRRRAGPGRGPARGCPRRSRRRAWSRSPLCRSRTRSRRGPARATSDRDAITAAVDDARRAPRRVGLVERRRAGERGQGERASLPSVSAASSPRSRLRGRCTPCRERCPAGRRAVSRLRSGGRAAATGPLLSRTRTMSFTGRTVSRVIVPSELRESSWNSSGGSGLSSSPSAILRTLSSPLGTSSTVRTSARPAEISTEAVRAPLSRTTSRSRPRIPPTARET